MRLLLSSAGVSNSAIAEALQNLHGKKPSDVKVGFVPTAANAEEGNKDWLIKQYLELWRYGYHWIDIVDPTFSGLDWQARLAEVDVVYVSGGNTFYLLDQVRKTGFDNWLEQNLENKVYVGGSASSILVTPSIEVAAMPPGDENVSGVADLTGLNWVNFEIEPHCDDARFAVIETYAKTRPNPVYAIDDHTAIQVIDGEVKAISKGSWKLYGQ